MKRRQTDSNSHSRRAFLNAAVAATGAAGVAGASGPLWARGPGYIREQNLIRVALVGCGGRGTGAAANILSTSGPIKLVAMADVFRDRLERSLRFLRARFEAQVDVPPERQFLGFDAYRKAIDQLGPTDVVLLATPPAFRPVHVEYAVQRGVNIFMEKSFAVDPPGLRRVLNAGRLAEQKGLKIAGGLMWRHDPPREEIVRRIHDGAIGEIILLRTYRMHGPVGFRPRRPGENELAHQIRNYSCFTWLNGSFFVDWLIHNIDVCCWAKGSWPVAAQGQGGRQVRREPDQMWDHYAVEYIFADGTRLFAQGRHIAGCWNEFADYAHGTRRSARIMQNLARANPVIYRRYGFESSDIVWRYEGPTPNPYQVEMDLLVDAIRNDRRYNETERCVYACMTAIMGRMAAHSGKRLTWEEVFHSEEQLAPNVDSMTWDSPPPVVPDERGRYPVAMPGQVS